MMRGLLGIVKSILVFLFQKNLSPDNSPKTVFKIDFVLITGANLISIPVLWSGEFSNVFNATMTTNRFCYLLSMLRLDNIDTREEDKR